MDRYKVVNGDYVALIDKILKQNLNTLLCSNNFSKNESSAMTNKDGRCEVTYSENRIKIDRETSVIIYVLRLIYENEKSETSQTNQGVYITTPTLIKTMMEFNISFSNKRLNGRSIAKSLRFLVNHNIINKVSGSYDEGNVSFYILPSICYAIDSLKIQAIANAIDRINAKQSEADMSNFDGGDF